MKVKIKKAIYDDGGLRTHKGDKYASKGRKAGWNASTMTDDQLKELAGKLGYDGPDDVKSFQKWILDNPNPLLRAKVDELHSKYGMPKAGEEADGHWGVRWDIYKDLLSEPEFTETPSNQQPTDPYKSQGRDYNFNPSTNKKPSYDKRALPFYQAAPDLAAFVAAQNTYNYYTPDYTHWEISPATLNIQPQLNEINAGANALYNSTTGNPQIDNIRRQGAFSASLNAKQQAYSNKQNYDANNRYQADMFNINARTQEQNLDVNAIQEIHNNYRALAKDFAGGERLRAINSLTGKYAQNEQNENMKKLWMDNFFPNYTSNGLYSMDQSGNAIFSERYYDVDHKDQSMMSSPSTTNQSVRTPIPSPLNPNYTPNNQPVGNMLMVPQQQQQLNLPPVFDYNTNTSRTIPGSTSPLVLPQYDTQDEVFDPVRNQMSPRKR